MGELWGRESENFVESTGTQRMRHPRLLRLITLGRGSETIETLAESLDVSEKTVRRDIAGLKKLELAINEQMHHLVE